MTLTGLAAPPLLAAAALPLLVALAYAPVARRVA
jgi:hypothetical protein